MPRHAARTALTAAAIAAWTSPALPDEPAGRPALPAPTYSAADLQRWLSDPRRGGDPTAPTDGFWIDPVCTGYGPGLGPRYVIQLPAPDPEAAAAARASPRTSSGAAEPSPPR